MAEMESKIPVIRTMSAKDLDRIVQIDTKVLGKSRSEYWEMKLELVEKRSPMASLVAEMDGEVVGFIIGDASGWEYGVSENIGWMRYGPDGDVYLSDWTDLGECHDHDGVHRTRGRIYKLCYGAPAPLPEPARPEPALRSARAGGLAQSGFPSDSVALAGKRCLRVTPRHRPAGSPDEAMTVLPDPEQSPGIPS